MFLVAIESGVLCFFVRVGVLLNDSSIAELRERRLHPFDFGHHYLFTCLHLHWFISSQHLKLCNLNALIFPWRPLFIRDLHVYFFICVSLSPSFEIHLKCSVISLFISSLPLFLSRIHLNTLKLSVLLHNCTLSFGYDWTVLLTLARV